MQRLIITLDGPAGSGKSTVSRRLAKRLGLEFLDTGAMYRGLTAKALERGINPAAEEYAVVELARHHPIDFDWSTDPPRLLVNESDLTHRLRDADVTARVNEVARIPAVRQVMVETQQRLGREHPRLVSEGRDQGSVVFPDAQVKFFLEATAEVRAQRRADQIRAAGRHADYEQIRRDIVARDHQDVSRKVGPLIQPPDAIRIDTSAMGLDEVVTLLEQHVRKMIETAPSVNG